MHRQHLKNLIILLSAFLTARVLFILLMPHTYSLDLHSWLRVMEILETGGNPYGQTEVLNWPPFWMQILYGVHQIAKHTGLNPVIGIQATLIICEAVVICVVYHVGQRYFEPKRLLRPILFGLAINPVCIFLSCQHCNFDVFVGLWILLAAWMLVEYFKSGRPDEWLMACFFIGMGILTKTVPVILTPLLLIGIRQLPWRKRVFGIILLVAPFLIGMSVLFSLEPHGVMQNVVGYRSMGGWYGITGLMWIFNTSGTLTLYKSISPFVFILLMLFTAWMSYKTDRLSGQQIIVSMLLLLMFVPTFGPGYSPPYILWYLPLLVLLYQASGPAIRRLLLCGWIITVLTYAVEYAFFESHGSFLQYWFPSSGLKSLCERLGARDMQTIIRLPMFICYLALFFTLLRSLRSSRPIAAFPEPEGRIS